MTHDIFEQRFLLNIYIYDLFFRLLKKKTKVLLKKTPLVMTYFFKTSDEMKGIANIITQYNYDKLIILTKKKMILASYGILFHYKLLV